MKKIAIIGGGASGLAAAISAAREAAAFDSPIQICLFEESDRVGKSILASGNGRCNFSNSNVAANKYFNAEFVADAFDALSPEETRVFFSDLGLLWHEESEGRLYPLSNKASSVLDVLRFAARDAGVHIYSERRVCAVTPVRHQYLISFADEAAEYFDAVIVACGGKVARSLLPVNYAYHNSQPLLGPLATDTEVIRGLNNIRARCAVSYKSFSEKGEVLFRDYGISGIVIFDLSRFVEAGDLVSIDFLPDLTDEDVSDMLNKRFEKISSRSALEFCAGILQQPLARAVLKAAGITPEASFETTDISALANKLKDFPLTIKGIADYRQCQVNRGGFDVKAFDARSCQSKNDSGLFVVGEALDVDGPCGGYNLHWAWTSGILAGKHSVQTVHQNLR